MFRVSGANHGEGGLQKIGDRGPFPHKLGIDADAEVLPQFLAAGFLQRGHDNSLRGSGQDGAAQYNQVKSILFLKNLADFPAPRFDMAKVKLSIPQTRRSHAKKGNVAVQDRIFGVRSRMQTARSMTLRNQLCHARLDHGTAARFHCFDLRRTKVDANNVMALAREAGRCDRSHVAQPKYADGWNHRNRYSFS